MFGYYQRAFQITVEDKLSFLKPLEDVEVLESEEALLLVETNTHPRIVKWYKNGQEIKASSGRIEMKNSTTKFQLIIKKAESADAADYKVSSFLNLSKQPLALVILLFDFDIVDA